MQLLGNNSRTGFHELFDEGVVRFAACARLAKAEIERVLQKYRVVCPDVDRDGKAKLWRNSGARCIERQLSDRNAHTAYSEVTKAEDPLAISYHEETHVLLRVRPGTSSRIA
jgi:hypothetical protein